MAFEYSSVFEAALSQPLIYKKGEVGFVSIQVVENQFGSLFLDIRRKYKKALNYQYSKDGVFLKLFVCWKALNKIKN